MFMLCHIEHGKTRADISNITFLWLSEFAEMNSTINGMKEEIKTTPTDHGVVMSASLAQVLNQLSTLRRRLFENNSIVVMIVTYFQWLPKSDC